jgi:hypothetical protein
MEDITMNKKDYMERTSKLARFTRKVCRVFIIAVIVGCGLLFITALVAQFVDPAHVKPLTSSNKSQLFIMEGLSIPSEAFTDIVVLRGYLWGMVATVMIGSAVFIKCARTLMGLLLTVEQGSPFEQSNVSRLRAMGVTLAVGSLLVPMGKEIAHRIMLRSAAKLVDMLQMNTVFGLDLTLLLCGFMVLVLSGVFAYGAWLQREHDQTV